jgi:hypothetical protein
MSDPGIGISPFYWTKKNKYFHLKMGEDNVFICTLKNASHQEKNMQEKRRPLTRQEEREVKWYIYSHDRCLVIK